MTTIKQTTEVKHFATSDGGSSLIENAYKILSATTQMKAIVQYFPVVLFILLYKVVLNFESVDEILKCDHSNESRSI